jgi:hypothetical protein
MDNNEISSEWNNNKVPKEWDAALLSGQQWDNPDLICPGSNTPTALFSQADLFSMPSTIGSSQIRTPVHYMQGLTDSKPFAPVEFFST